MIASVGCRDSSVVCVYIKPLFLYSSVYIAVNNDMYSSSNQ